MRPVRNFQEERAKLRKRLAKLKDLYLEEMIDMEMYRRDYASLNARLTALEKEEQSQGFHPAGTEQLKSLFSSGWEELYTQLSREEKQSFWRVAIDQILIYPTRHIKIQIKCLQLCKPLPQLRALLLEIPDRPHSSHALQLVTVPLQLRAHIV